METDVVCRLSFSAKHVQIKIGAYQITCNNGILLHKKKMKGKDKLVLHLQTVLTRKQKRALDGGCDNG
ncbi:hypothetical protein PoB_004669900 [Plakobranchus ocellatus]|uniref:Uncharacterized protein n=1 Tax=Plakobranchus ocellatus TaxID=259542 RepID=A0AAV4BJ98_9GAST|nr:hypothetical protein PoB_004669900 [Plakobranchus ocellatus]